MTLLVTLLGLSTAAITIVVLANLWRFIDYTSIEPRPADQLLSQAGSEISVLTWNIGYAALGKEADVFVDGGTSLRALSKQQIIAATHEIAQTLAESQADVICLQETAQPGFLTRHVDVQRVIDDALSHLDRYFWADLKTAMLPRMLRNSNGMASYFGKSSSHPHIAKLPDATAYMLGFIKKPYVGLVSRLPIQGSDKSWLIFNMHLPFFKTTNTERAAQLAHLFSLAKKEYDNGNYVVIAGDWNARLCPTSFKHATDPKFLTSFKDFPEGSLPSDWRVQIDPQTPTVRSLNAAYKSGETYTTIFDGFVVSPNVRVSNIHTSDLGFAHSDHQPVKARFSVEK